jgi:hypothetical protein
MRTLRRRRFYPKIALCLLKTIQSSFQLLILALKFCGLVIKKKIGKLFHTISFFQFLFILLKFYFLFKNKIFGQNIVKLWKSQNTTDIE